MDSDAKRPAGVTMCGGIAGGRRALLTRALRVMPTLAALTIWCAFIGACGRLDLPQGQRLAFAHRNHHGFSNYRQLSL